VIRTKRHHKGPERDEFHGKKNPRVNKDVFKFSFGHRVIDEWNKLPEEVIKAEGINLFKTKLDKFLRNKWGSL